MADAIQGLMSRKLSGILRLRREELAPALWSALYFFCVLSAYYILRPLRDEMGLAGGVRNLPLLWTGTLVVTLLAHPLFSKLVVRLRRAAFIGVVYRFFGFNLLVFFLLLTLFGGSANLWIGRVFYVWTSVFNLFVVSVFWALMVDAFRPDQSKRVFGLVALGGTLGAVVGASMTALLSTVVGPVNLLLVAVVLLEASVHCAWTVLRWPQKPRDTLQGEEGPDAEAASVSDTGRGRRKNDPDEEPIGGSVWAGLRHTVRSRYLMGIMAFILLFTVSSSLVYFQQAEIIASHFTDRAHRTAVFASIDLAVNLVTIGTQLLLTSRILQRLGVGLTLAILPVVSLVGFFLLGLRPLFSVLVGFQVLRRSSNYALNRPAREVLFTVLEREDKYKAKNLIDTLVYRTGDQLGAWLYALLILVGCSVAGVSFTAVILCVVWLFLALWLGKQQRHLGRPETSGSSAHE